MNSMESKVLLDKEIINNIVNTLKCDRNDVKNIVFMKIGLTNISFKFSVKNKDYVYRHPGNNTKIFINRKSEVYSETKARELGLDKTIVHIDESGWKISKFINNSTTIDPYNIEDQKVAMKLIKKLHKANIISPYDFDYINETNKFIRIFKKQGNVNFSKYEPLHKEISKLSKKIENLGYKKVLCHNDYWFYNILKDEKGKLSLIDWEYSGNYYPGCDVAYFISSLDFDDEQYLKLAELYEGHKLNNKETYYYEAILAITMWYWYVWALYKEANGKKIDDKKMWLAKAKRGLKQANKIGKEICNKQNA